MTHPPRLAKLSASTRTVWALTGKKADNQKIEKTAIQKTRIFFP
jgi:hypothetical protein